MSQAHDAQGVASPSVNGRRQIANAPYTRGGGPRLDVDEWTFLTHLFLSNGSVPLAAGHADLLAVAPLLRKLAARRGASRSGQTLRSAAGLSRRVGMLRRVAQGDTAGVPQVARTVYEMYAGDPASCARRVAQLMSALSSQQTMKHLLAAPSRGPLPMGGVFEVERSFEPMTVYLLVLAGPRGVIYPYPSAPARRFVKIGITGDLERRSAELNQAFPPGIGLAWRVADSIGDVPPTRAFEIEQALLSRLFEMGVTLGGEFAAVELTVIRCLMDMQRTHLLAEGPRTA